MPTPSFDPFEALGVSRKATAAEIRAAYRELAGRYHPDKHRGNPLEELANEKLRDINRAYEILSDDARRAAYEAETRAPTSRRAPSAVPAGEAVAVEGPGGQLMRALRSFGLLATLVVFIKFGVSLSREIFLVLRAVAMSLLWVVRLSPILAIAVVMVAGMGLSLLLKSRKRS